MLTRGAIGHILAGKDIQQPILQMLAFKHMPADNTKRYRLVLSDGAYSYQCCMVMGDLSAKVESGEFDRFCLLKINRYQLNLIQGRQVIVLADPKLHVSGSEINEKIDNPVAYGSPDAPPLSRFPPNYHLNQSSNQQSEMDMEFDNDPFDDMDVAVDKQPNRSMSSTSNQPASKKQKNNSGQSSNSRNANQENASSLNQINPQFINPISAITPYCNKWVIKGRCTSKSSKRTWSNAKGEGVLFNFALKDESGDIKITAFKNEVERFFDLIEPDKIYLVSKGMIKDANKQYNHTTSKYEITTSSDTIIEECEDESGCPTVQYNFVKIDELHNHAGGFVDVIAVIKQMNEVDKIVSNKTKKELAKRNVTLIDRSEKEIELTLWEQVGINLTAEVGDVLILRGVRVTEYNSLSLSSTTNTVIELNSNLDEVHNLKGWFSRVKDNLNSESLTVKSIGGQPTEWSDLSIINPEKVQNENQIYFQVKATIVAVGKATAYKACEQCNKKLTQISSDFCKCDKCNTETDRFNWKILLSCNIADHLANTWIQVFHDDVVRLLGPETNIDELCNLASDKVNEFEERLKVFNLSSHVFKLKSKMEHFNDENRIRTQAMKIVDVNYADYGAYLIKSIRED